MPARSNAFQAVVYFVKANLDPAATVTESASLPDRITGQDREVDVLITGHVAGQLIRIGVECRSWKRKQDVGWVEEMQSKHADLPTDQLVLVSSSGFTKKAVEKAQFHNIQTVKPDQPIPGGGPLARLGHPALELRNLTREHLAAIHGHIELDGRSHTVGLIHQHVLFAADGAELGRVADVIKPVLHQIDTRSSIMHAVAGKQYLLINVGNPGAYLGVNQQSGVFLRTDNATPAYLVGLASLDIYLAVHVSIQPVKLSAGHLQGAAFAYGTGHVGGADALMVFTEGPSEAHLAVRLTDAFGSVTDWTAHSTTQQLLPRMS